MKKLLFCMLIFATSTSLAQTKEETIAWLTEKFSQSANFYMVSIDECKVIFWYSDDWDMWQEIIPLNGLLIDASGYLALDYEGIRQEHYEKFREDSPNEGRFFRLKTSHIKISETEPNLHERIIKAITHLNTFCVEEEEPF
jgi:hypothetical protein